MEQPPNSLRFVDYFFRTGIQESTDISKSKIIYAENHDIDKQHPILNRYEPETIFRYPEADYSEKEKFPLYTPLFCFPSDVQFKHQEVGKPVDTFHSFVLMINKVITESNGSKAYGVCLTTYKIPSKKRMFQIDSLIGNWRSKNLASSDYEFAQHVLRQIAAEREKLLKLKVAGPDSGETPETKSAIEETILVLEELLVPLKSTVLVDAENSYEPVCLGVLSKWPWYNLLHDWLCLVVKNLQESGGSFPFERYAVNLVHEIPLPPPGKLELSIPFEHYTLYCSRPPLNSSPFSYYPLFRCMSVENIVTMFEMVATEYKIVLVSEHASMLNLVAECLSGWLYPLYWHHILIPVLPARLISYLEAPVPFLVGIQKQSFPQWESTDWRPVDAAVIDLDHDHIDFPPLKIKIPHRERKKLVGTLHKHTHRAFSSPLGHSIQKEIPRTMKAAFPDGKLILQSAESIIDYRKVADIPKFMYSTFSNSFLQQKSGNVVHKNSKLHVPIQSGISQSFDNVVHHNPPEVKQKKGSGSIQANTDTLHDSIASFHTSPRPSDAKSNKSNQYSESNESTTHKKLDIMVSLHDAIINGPEDQQSSDSVTSPSKTALTPNSLKFPNWWSSKPTTDPATSATSSRPPSRETSKKKTPSFFERLLGSENSVASNQPISEVTESVEQLHEDPVSVSHQHEEEPMKETIIYKDGHVFHELIPSNTREVDIDENQEQVEEEYADRFVAESDSSDEFSRSDMSTMTDTKPQLFIRKSQRTAGQGRNAPKELFKRRAESITASPTKTEQVKRSDRNECKVCKLDYDPKIDRIFMCEHCHVQIHCDCLDLVETHPCPLAFNEEKIGHAFFKLFTSLLRHYRHYIKFPAGGREAILATEDTSTSNWFKKVEFLSEFDSESKGFMSVLIETQAFAQFLLDRIERPESDYEVMFFDESIKQKLNRSRMRFTKEPTPFLNETTYRYSTKFPIVSINTEHLPHGGHSQDRFAWKPEYVCEPRPVQVLLTEADMEIMRVHTNELLNRSHSKGKQDFSKWMRSKWKTNKGVPDIYTSDDQRRDILEDRMASVGKAIAQIESSHLSSQTIEQIDAAIKILHEQNLILLKTTDEEQLLVDRADEEEFQRMIKRLIRLITLYEEQRLKTLAITPLRSRMSSRTSNEPPPLPPRRQTTEPQSATTVNRITNWVSEIPPGSVPRSNSIDSTKEDQNSQLRSSTSTRSSMGRDFDEQEEFGSFDNLNSSRPTVSQRQISQEVFGSFDNLQQDAGVQIKLYENLNDEFGSFEQLGVQKTQSIEELVERKTVTAISITITPNPGIDTNQQTNNTTV